MIMKLWVSIFVDMIGIIPVKLERMWYYKNKRKIRSKNKT